MITAAINAFSTVYPGAVLRGCFFHYAQCNFRHIKRNSELLAKVNMDSDFSLNIRQLIALAFLPPQDVESAYQEMEKSRFFKDNETVLDEYLEYFSTTWIGSFNRRGERKKPLFEIKLWNCYDSLLQSLPKTNNICEGFHRGFAGLLSVHHPTLYKLIDGLLKQQSLTDVKMTMVDIENTDKGRKKWSQLAIKLKKLVESYPERRDTPSYLRGIAKTTDL